MTASWSETERKALELLEDGFQLTLTLVAVAACSSVATRRSSRPRAQWDIKGWQLQPLILRWFSKGKTKKEGLGGPTACCLLHASICVFYV